MAWGKDKLRNVCRQTKESLVLISDNYRALDHDYQMLGKALLDIKEIVEKAKDNNYETIGNDTNKIIEIIEKELELEKVEE